MTQAKRLRWRKLNPYTIESDHGHRITHVGGKYQCWAAPGTRVRGFLTHTAWVGFHTTDSAQDAKQAVVQLAAGTHPACMPLDQST